jgi:hypothetical protein
MSAQGLAAADWPEIEISRAEQFKILDARAREIEEITRSTWVELADLCTTMRDSELWKEGGYHSFHDWLRSACPTARSTAYAAIGNMKELEDIPREDLEQIPPGNAGILAGVPKQKRNGKILKAAKTQTPREFTATVIREAPESHVEQKICHKFRMSTSQSKILQAALDMWCVLNEDPDAPNEDILEGIVSDYMQTHQDEYTQATQYGNGDPRGTKPLANGRSRTGAQGKRNGVAS